MNTKISNYTYTHTATVDGSNQLTNWTTDNPSFTKQVNLFGKYLPDVEAMSDQMGEALSGTTGEQRKAIRAKWDAAMQRIVERYEAAAKAAFGDQALTWNQMVALAYPA